MPDEIDSAEAAIASALCVEGSCGTPAFTEAVQQRIDLFEDFLASEIVASELHAADCPLKHVFTPGLYARTITMPAGAIVVSKIHRTEHPFVVSKGAVRVFIEGVGWETIRAPHIGVTKPMTRRVLIVLDECVWSTFHATDKQTPDEVEAEIIFQRSKQLSKREE